MNIINSLKTLSEKDKRTVKAGSVALLFILYLFLVLLPLKDNDRQYSSRIERKMETAKEVVRMSARYKELKAHHEAGTASSKAGESDFTLFSFLDRAASEAGLKDYIKLMKPSVRAKDGYKESTVVLELEDVALEPLTGYLHAIETSGHKVRIKKVDIKPRYSSPNKLNVTLIISAVEMR